MEKIYKKPFENMKKISLDVNEEILDVIDEFAKLTKSNRTVVIGAVIGQGIPSFFRYLEASWKELLNQKEINEEKKEKLNKLLKGLKKLEETKWGFQKK